VGSYYADVEDLHIEIDRCEQPSGYLDWFLFISRVLDDGSRDIGIYTTYARTYREATVLAKAYADADVILKQAVTR
jgi:hypothetical protein